VLQCPYDVYESYTISLEVMREASVGISGNAKLLVTQLFNELTTAYG